MNEITPKKKRKNRDNIYEYFDDYSEEKIDDAISKLIPKYRALLHTRYGENLKQPKINKNMDAKQLADISNAFARIKQILSSDSYNSNSASKSSVLTNNEKKAKSEEKIEKMSILMTEKINFEENNRLEKISFTNNEYLTMLEILKQPFFQKHIMSLTSEEIIILFLKLGFFEEKQFSTKEICDFLKIEPLIVLNIVKKELNYFKKMFCDVLNSIIEKEETELFDNGYTK